MAYLTSGFFALADNIWGKTLRHLGQHLPQVLLYTILQLTDFFYCRHDQKCVITSWWGECYRLLWECHCICPLLEQFQVTQVTQPELSPLTLVRGMGWCQKILQWHDIFTNIGQKSYHRRDGVQACHGVGTPLPSPCLYFGWGSKENSPYSPHLAIIGPTHLCGFNEDTQHVPLPKEGHLSAMIKGAPSRIACRHLCQTRSTSSLRVRVPSGVPGRAEWGPGAGSNISTRITCPKGEYAWLIHIPTSGPLPVHSKQLCAWGLNPPQNFDSNFPYTTWYGTSP